MNEITDQSQSASLENWYLTHSVLVVKEVIDEAKREKKKCPFFKVNYEKTYDSINWDILIYMLRRMGFCEEWVGWIRCCLESSSILVLVNESPIGEFKVQRGLRQGGKFVHFFFNIEAEGLCGMMKQVIEKKLYASYLVGKLKIEVNLLKYADDTLFFGDHP